MMTSSGEDNWPWEFGSPFLSSFRHISPSGGFCQVSELTVYTKKWRPSAMGVRTFARIKHLIWDQLLASEADIIQS